MFKPSLDVFERLCFQGWVLLLDRSGEIGKKGLQLNSVELVVSVEIEAPVDLSDEAAGGQVVELVALVQLHELVYVAVALVDLVLCHELLTGSEGVLKLCHALHILQQFSLLDHARPLCVSLVEPRVKVNHRVVVFTLPLCQYFLSQLESLDLIEYVASLVVEVPPNSFELCLRFQ